VSPERSIKTLPDLDHAIDCQVATQVANFEVGPGDGQGIQQEIFSEQYDFGDNTLDKKIKNDL